MPRSESPLRSELFPDIVPYTSGMLALDAVHTLYWEQSGNPDGLPVVFLHGGPGAGCAPVHRRFFDPQFYRIILFDQRGCGRSVPLGELTNNTTAHLVEDLDKLRRHLGVAQWLVFGGSWGSTLGIAYGLRYPAHCLGFILRGIFLGSRTEIAWFLHGMRQIFPEAWREFVHFLPPEERDDILGNYYRRLTDPDPDRHRVAARQWSRYEASCSALYPGNKSNEIEAGNFALALARIEAHYFVNNTFLPQGWPYGELANLRHLPCTVVQGRYDIVCPPVTAEELSRAWPELRYVVVPDAGHSALEPGIRSALVNATEAFRLAQYAGEARPGMPWEV